MAKLFVVQRFKISHPHPRHCIDELQNSKSNAISWFSLGTSCDEVPPNPF
jgi:hypothetical protein